MTWSAYRRMHSSPSVATAMTRPLRARTSSMFPMILSYVPHRGAMNTTGMPSWISAIGPCFISAAGSPFWMEIKVFDAAGKPAKGLPGKDGYFEMAVPKALLTDKKLEVTWIDFFRG